MFSEYAVTRAQEARTSGSSSFAMAVMRSGESDRAILVVLFTSTRARLSVLGVLGDVLASRARAVHKSTSSRISHHKGTHYFAAWGMHAVVVVADKHEQLDMDGSEALASYRVTQTVPEIVVFSGELERRRLPGAVAIVFETGTNYG